MRRVPVARSAPVAAAFVLLASAMVCFSGSVTRTAEAASRHVVVVSDSILLGAQSPLTQRLGGAGWSVTFDGSVSRSTLAGAEAVRSHDAELTDTLVISLGANDSGNPSTFARRVDAVMAAAAKVPNVKWLTIREVRPYYGPANQVLRDATARYPNLHLVDWNAATLGRTDLTGSDGLHLNGQGASMLADVVTASVLGSVPVASPTPLVAASPDPLPAAPTDPATGAAQVDPPPVGGEAPAPVTVPVLPAPVPSPGFDRMWFVVGYDDADVARGTAARSTRSPAGVDGSGGGGLPVLPVALVSLLLLTGVVAVVRRRGVPEGPSGPVRRAAMTRAELRAARIAGSRDRHPTGAEVPPVPDEVGRSAGTHPPRTLTTELSQ